MRTLPQRSHSMRRNHDGNAANGSSPWLLRQCRLGRFYGACFTGLKTTLTCLPGPSVITTLPSVSFRQPAILQNTENNPMSQDLFAVVVAVLVFLSGIGGLVYQTWDPRNEEVNETRDLINRLTGLVATLSALVLGLLIASANNFYNSQKTGLETVSARVLALDGVLRRYGPDAKPARDTLKELITGSYTHVWQGDKGTLTTPTVEQAEERMDRLFVTLNALREAAPDSRKYLMAKAGDLATVDQQPAPADFVAAEQLPILALHDHPDLLGMPAVLRLRHARAVQSRQRGWAGGRRGLGGERDISDRGTEQPLFRRAQTFARAGPSDD